MKISELIAVLEKARAEHGDVEVSYWTGYDGWDEIAKGVTFNPASGPAEDIPAAHVRID